MNITYVRVRSHKKDLEKDVHEKSSQQIQQTTRSCFACKDTSEFICTLQMVNVSGKRRSLEENSLLEKFLLHYWT